MCAFPFALRLEKRKIDFMAKVEKGGGGGTFLRATSMTKVGRKGRKMAIACVEN